MGQGHRGCIFHPPRNSAVPAPPPLSVVSPHSEVNLICIHLFIMTHLVLRNFKCLKVKGTDTAC